MLRFERCHLFASKLTRSVAEPASSRTLLKGFKFVIRDLMDGRAHTLIVLALREGIQWRLSESTQWQANFGKLSRKGEGRVCSLKCNN